MASRRFWALLSLVFSIAVAFYCRDRQPFNFVSNTLVYLVSVLSVGAVYRCCLSAAYTQIYPGWIREDEFKRLVALGIAHIRSPIQAF
ncbi:hypothetical protein ACKFKF_02785 [Phormidesmis sp. 146-12]